MANPSFEPPQPVKGSPWPARSGQRITGSRRLLPESFESKAIGVYRFYYEMLNLLNCPRCLGRMTWLHFSFCIGLSWKKPFFVLSMNHGAWVLRGHYRQVKKRPANGSDDCPRFNDVISRRQFLDILTIYWAWSTYSVFLFSAFTDY